MKFLHHFEIRWLSLGKCFSALLRNYELLMVMLSAEADPWDAVAKGMFMHLTSYRFLALLHLMTDILCTTHDLSKLFQCRDVTISTLQPCKHFYMKLRC